MKANLSLQFTTSYGKPLKPVTSAGCLVASVDYDGTTGRMISIDTSRDGSPAEKLSHARIRVYDRAGVPVFSGTYDELTDLIRERRQP